MQELVELLKLDPQLVAGKFSSTFAQKVVEKKWEAIINALPGTSKCFSKWCKVPMFILGDIILYIISSAN